MPHTDTLPPRIGEAVSSQSDPSPAVEVAPLELQSLPHTATIDGELTDSASAGHPSAPPAPASAGAVSSPKHFPAFAEHVRSNPYDYVHRLMFNVRSGAAWNKPGVGTSERWGLVDKADLNYGYATRSILSNYIYGELKNAEFEDPHVGVSSYPGNSIRVVVHLGDTEVFDCTFAFTKARVL